jgi:hypothetical protein
MEAVTGSTPDISAYALFDFYQPVWYYTPTESFPHQKRVIGRWLGVADNCTDDLAYYILPSSCKLKVRKDVWAVTADEMANPGVRAELAALDSQANTQLLGNAQSGDQDFPLPDWDVLSSGDGEDEPYDTDQVKHEADAYTPEELDEYISALVMIPQGGNLTRATVKRRVRDQEGRPTGKRNSNPILDTRLYEVEFPDGSTEAFTANTIAENLYAQMDKEGNLYQILKEIVDHEKDNRAISKDNGWVMSGNGQRKPKITTIGWSFQVEWADGSTSWVPLKDLKASNPVEVAEYVVANQISEEPAFAWWVRPTLRKRDRIIKKVKSRYWERTHKYGVEMPKAVSEALAIDRRNGNSLWRDAIEKEMKNVMAAFEFKDDNVMPIGYKKIDVHMIFDVKSDLTRKARLVAGGHQTDPPKESTYSSVVSRDSVRIAFTLAALNGLDVLAGDIQNAYLNAGTKEKVYTIAGPEFGSNAKRPVLIVRALYGLKSSGARWRDHISGTLRSGGFTSCYADPDIWMRQNCKPDGTKYWEYVLCYVDDILVVSHDPQKVMNYLEESYTLKAGSVGPPKDYLGAQVTKYSLAPNGRECWAMSSDLYIKRAIADVERELAQIDRALKSKASTPMTAGYRPELDISDELDPRRANYFQGLIGVLRWIVELGRVDILVAVAMLSRYLAMPRTGHLEEAIHVFAYLKQYNRSTLVFDDSVPKYDENRFMKCDWSEYYPDAAEAIPHNLPEARGEAVTTTCFVDADHAGCQVTRRSHSGILLFLQKAPIIWYSKRQNTVESSTFGSEFVAMKIAIEQIEALRYKLRMMGVPLDGPTNVFCDNEAVFKNSTKPESTLKKKHNAIAYHRTREAQAAGMVRIAWEQGEFNLADILTKLLPGPKLREMSGRILY